MSTHYENDDNIFTQQITVSNKLWKYRYIIDGGFLCTEALYPTSYFIRNRFGKWCFLPEKNAEVVIISSEHLEYKNLQKVYREAKKTQSQWYISQDNDQVAHQLNVVEFLSDNERAYCSPTSNVSVKKLSTVKQISLTQHLKATCSNSMPRERAENSSENVFSIRTQQVQNIHLDQNSSKLNMKKTSNCPSKKDYANNPVFTSSTILQDPISRNKSPRYHTIQTNREQEIPETDPYDFQDSPEGAEPPKRNGRNQRKPRGAPREYKNARTTVPSTCSLKSGQSLSRQLPTNVPPVQSNKRPKSRGSKNSTRSQMGGSQRIQSNAEGSESAVLHSQKKNSSTISNPPNLRNNQSNIQLSLRKQDKLHAATMGCSNQRVDTAKGSPQCESVEGKNSSSNSSSTADQSARMKNLKTQLNKVKTDDSVPPPSKDSTQSSVDRDYVNTDTTSDTSSSQASSSVPSNVVQSEKTSVTSCQDDDSNEHINVTSHDDPSSGQASADSNSNEEHQPSTAMAAVKSLATPERRDPSRNIDGSEEDSSIMRGNRRGQSRNTIMNQLKRNETIDYPSHNTRSKTASKRILSSVTNVSVPQNSSSKKCATSNEAIELKELRKPETVEPKQDHSAIILANIKSKLKGIYINQYSWLAEVPWLNGDSPACFQLEVRTKEKFSRIDAKYMFDSREKLVLLRNESNFGKSALCAFVIRQWVHNELKDFELCLHVDLKSKSLSLYDTVIQNCSDRSITPEQVEESLSVISDKILVLVDSLNNELGRKEVAEFLTSRRVFEKSTILVTSRPIDTDDRFLQLFDKHVQILGLDLNILAKLIDLKRFEIFYKNSKARFLTGFPPQYIYGTLQMAKICDVETINLFDLLDNILKMSSKRHDLNENTIDFIYCKLGSFFLSALLQGTNTIEIEMFESIFGEYRQFLFSLGIFLPSKDSITTKLLTPKILMVFFTTWFLRHKWSKCNTLDRDSLLKQYFCCGGTVGDFVFETSSSTQVVYFVGVLPEVVLKMKPDDPVFEMYYDTRAVEHSSAFDAINLLARIGDRYLNRFGFVKPSKNVQESLEKVFDDLIVLLDFDLYSVETRFYCNEYENRDFMTVNVEQPGNDSPMLQLVVIKKRNSSEGTANRVQYEQLHLSFSFSKYKTIEPFLRSVLPQKCSDQIHLSNSMSLGEFIFETVLALSKIDGKRSMQIGVNGSEIESFIQSKTFIFYVKTDPREGPRFWLVYHTVKPFQSNERDFKLESFQTNKSDIISSLDNCASTLSNHNVTIHLN